MNYYNEWDPQAAAWLRELIENKLIPEGVVDERSITEVQAKDLKGFTQCHFFAGVGGWPLALQIAGIPATQRLWTGSPPCQPFSVAGAGKGKDDPRHLAPTFLNLIADCRPALMFGEQVAAAVTKDFWIDSLLFELEEEGYSSGFSVLPACGVGAPHKRDRLFFGACRMANGDDDRQQSGSWRRRGSEPSGKGNDIRRGSALNKLADTYSEQRNRGRDERSRRRIESANGSGDRSVAHTDSERFQRERRDSDSQGREGPDFRQTGLLDGAGAENNTANPGHGFWSDADWLGCRDGKFRPVESGTFPLANGIPARVGRLRGYGNAIVPQVAAEFIKAFMAAKAETETKA
jgi:DNA (cytosine-5)-methyltransferase 1